MRFRATAVFSLFAITLSAPLFASRHTRRGPTAQHLSNKRASAVHRPVAERVIDTDRAAQIQTALIARGYLTGSATGNWNPETQEALKKLQAENGWQTKVVPDARAIIKLGLGPGSSTPDKANAAPPQGGGPMTAEPELSTSSQR